MSVGKGGPQLEDLRGKEYAGVWKRRREGREFQEASTCAKVLRREEFQRTQ